MKMTEKERRMKAGKAPTNIKVGETPAEGRMNPLRAEHQSDEAFTKSNISKVYVSLQINRLPIETYKVFKELAKVECCDDYGWLLDKLIHNYIERETYDYFNERINRLSEEIDKINHRLDEDKSKDNNINTPNYKIETDQLEGVMSLGRTNK